MAILQLNINCLVPDMTTHTQKLTQSTYTLLCTIGKVCTSQYSILQITITSITSLFLSWLLQFLTLLVL